MGIMMDYNYNRIFVEIRKLFLKSLFLWFIFIVAALLCISALCLSGAVQTNAMRSALWLIPASAGFLIILLLYNSHMKTLARKHEISIMAYHAKQALSILPDSRENALNECRIRMRYLAKNGVDIDRALHNVNGNVEKLNEFILCFVGESSHLKDDLLNLIKGKNMPEYAAKTHALRVNANLLGLNKLTDTAFFHEIEACADNTDMVIGNWEKLSAELDEACSIFNMYIRSLGLNDEPMDDNGNRISFKKIGEQLTEALDALETYDTIKAKNILNRLLEYHIDADVTNNIKNIISNIDSIMYGKIE